jgi:hypothetical protein
VWEAKDAGRGRKSSQIFLVHFGVKEEISVDLLEGAWYGLFTGLVVLTIRRRKFCPKDLNSYF